MKHYTFYRFSISFLFSLTFSSLAFSQEPPIKWGEIPRADLEMKSYPLDTNASAVILCDYGESYRDAYLYRVIYYRHLRVKVLTPNGYKLGTESFTIDRQDKSEKVYDIEGITYSLNDRGEIVKDELLQKDIFTKEQGNSRIKYWFTLPALKPGCIFEFRYTIAYRYMSFNDWVFQYENPVRWSEYRILFPGYLGFVAVHQGGLTYAIHENSVVPMKSGTEKWAKMRWVIQDAPALKEEPFITTIEDYAQRVYIVDGDGTSSSYDTLQSQKKWKDWLTDLLEDVQFGKKIDDTRTIRKLAEQISGGLTTQLDKVKALYSWVSKTIKYSGFATKYSWTDVDEILEQKKGTNADINFLLLSLLKAVGIDSDPVILSTRRNGKFMPFFPVRYQFDYVLARAKIDSQYYYLDATDPQRPFDILPIKVLNVKGLIVKEDTLEWIKFSSQKRYSNLSAANIILQKDGSITGTLEDLYRDYGKLAMRDSLYDKKDITVAQELFESEIQGIALDSIAIEGKDSIGIPLKIRAQISSPTYAQCNSDLIYFNPHILHRMKENPLKSEKRSYPLDYAYPREYSAVINITIPDSFEIHESVVTRKLAVGSNLAVFSRKVMAQENQIRVQYKWEIRETEIDTTYYERMRDFYAQIIAIESEQFVFAHIKPLPSDTPNKLFTTPAKKQVLAPLKKGKK